jgi:type II secretory pathway pseudopilin PulG
MFCFNNKKRTKGFSIIELIVYLSVLIMLILVLFNSLISTTKSYSAIKSTRSINTSAVGVFNRVSNEIRSAKQVNTLPSVFLTSPGVLSVTKDTQSGEVTTVFSLNNGSLRVYVDGVDTGGLIKTNTQVTSLIFKHYTGVVSDAISIEMEIESTNGKSTRSEVFKGTYTLRGAY